MELYILRAEEEERWILTNWRQPLTPSHEWTAALDVCQPANGRRFPLYRRKTTRVSEETRLISLSLFSLCLLRKWGNSYEQKAVITDTLVSKMCAWTQSWCKNIAEAFEDAEGRLSFSWLRTISWGGGVGGFEGTRSVFSLEHTDQQPPPPAPSPCVYFLKTVFFLSKDARASPTTWTVF